MTAPVYNSLGAIHSARKVETAAFKSKRNDLLFSGNDIPAPG